MNRKYDLHGAPDTPAPVPARLDRFISTHPWIERNYRRVRARSFGQLIRGASLRIWPLSSIVRDHYRVRLAAPAWNAINRRARATLESCPARLDTTQQSTLEGLQRDGVYRTSVAELLPGSAVDMLRVRADAETLLQRPATREQIVSRRSREGVKWYVVRAFGYRPRLPVPASFVELLLNDRVLAVANAYLGVTSRLKYLDVWHNFPVAESDPPIDSELWHRDNEDRNLVKLFVYLSDVDDTAGPLTYIRGSQPGGPHGALFPSDPPSGSYPPKRELEQLIPESSLARCTGDAGTMVWFDACGLHRGGRATARARTLLVATYASDAALDLLKDRLADPAQYETLSPAARYAIRAPEA
jgi:hypothetical protein